MTAPTSLWAFEGLWTVERSVKDFAGGPDGGFSGTATLARVGQRLRYSETGTLTLDGVAPMAATRAYIWRQEGGWLHIDYDDGRPFHGIPFGVEEPETTHLCDPDRYEVAYDFRAWPEWTANWRVTGPRKDYRMQSRYRRAT